MKKRIGVFGGSFDPIHLGHEALARAAVKELKLDKLLVIPANIQPFKQDWKVTPGEHRMKMAELVFEDDEKIELCSFELDHEDVSYTFDTLEYVQTLYPLDENEIVFVMGTDSFLSFERWYRAKTMFKTYSLGVSRRPGYREDELFYKADEYRMGYKTPIYIIQTEMPDISSTRVRQILNDGDPENDDSLYELLNEKVVKYIKENELYGE